MPFLGNAALILAFLVAIYAIASALLDSRKNKYGIPTGARLGVFIVAGLLTLAEVLLLVAFLTHNFGLLYVADYSARDTPVIYLITGLWAGNAGSLLFWTWIIALSCAVLTWRSNKSNRDLKPHAISLLLFTEILFLILLLIPPFFQQSPFQSLLPVPADGLGLKPVLQTPLMVFHPPVLLAGYAILTVPFALAMAALFNRQVDDAWVLTTKRWAVAAWLLLGLGNVLGMWWAYAELGWGGYWAWDPVENAGLIPWLLITAFLHSSMMYLRRGLFRMWGVVLAVAAFWLTIFGAFLTRSTPQDISVHSFGQTSATPVFIIFLAVTLIGSVWLLIDRRAYMKSAEGDDTLVSGTGTFLGVNLLLVVSAAITLIGTVLPFFTGATTPAAYFNIVNLPIFLAVVLVAGLCVLVGWKKPDVKKLNRKLIWAAVVAVVLTPIIIILTDGTAGLKSWYALAGIFVVVFIVISTFLKWGADVASRMHGKKEGCLPALGRLFVANRSRYGGYIIHIAIAVLALGIIGSSAYKSQSQIEQTFNVGDSVTLQGYTITYNGIDTEPVVQKGENTYWLKVIASLDILRDGKAVASLHPSETLQFVTSGETVTDMTPVAVDVGIQSSLSRDYYTILEDFDGTTEQALLKVLINPLVQWIWIGGFLLLIGGLVSLSAAPRKIMNTEDKE